MYICYHTYIGVCIFCLCIYLIYNIIYILYIKLFNNLYLSSYFILLSKLTIINTIQRFTCMAVYKLQSGTKVAYLPHAGIFSKIFYSTRKIFHNLFPSLVSFYPCLILFTIVSFFFSNSSIRNIHR